MSTPFNAVVASQGSFVREACCSRILSPRLGWNASARVLAGENAEVSQPSPAMAMVYFGMFCTQCHLEDSLAVLTVPPPLPKCRALITDRRCFARSSWAGRRRRVTSNPRAEGQP